MFGVVAEEIRNSLDSLSFGYSHEELGKIVELERSAVTKFLSTSREINFMSTLKFAQLIHPRNYINVLQRWATKCRKPENIKFVLEFLSANRMLKALKCYINTIKKEVPSSSIQDLIPAYELLLKFQSVVSVGVEFLDEIEKLKALKPETKYIKSVLKVYFYNDHHNMKLVEKALDDSFKILKNISKDSLRDIYVVRLYEMESTCNLFKLNNYERTREVSEKILSNLDFFGASYEARHYYRVGMSYFYSSPDMCIANLKKSIKAYRKIESDELAEGIKNNELNLAMVYWGRITSSDDVKGTPSEAHFFAKEGDFNKAKSVINKLNNQSPFTKYYKGVAEDNPFVLLESLKDFINKGNRFYAKLPLEALEKYPQAEGLVKLLIKERI
jgi:tetratricopeptide (TPR) repeat protein